MADMEKGTSYKVFILVIFWTFMLNSCSHSADELVSKSISGSGEKLRIAYKTISFSDTTELLFGAYPTPGKRIICELVNAKGEKVEFNYYLYVNLKSRDDLIKDAALFANSNAQVVCFDTICFRDSLLIRFAQEDVKKIRPLSFCVMQKNLNDYLRKEVYEKGAARTFSW